MHTPLWLRCTATWSLVLSSLILLPIASQASAAPAEKQRRAGSYTAWQYQADKGRYWCTYNYTNGSGRASFQYVMYYPDESRRGLYFWQDRSGQTWGCCVRPGAPGFEAANIKWYRKASDGKWAQRAGGDNPKPPDGGAAIAGDGDAPLPVTPPPREFASLGESERALAERLHQRLAEVTLEKRQIVAVDFSGNQVDDKLLAELSNLSGLQRLYLDTTNVSDNSLKQIATLPSLTHLDISQTGVSDGGLKHLANLPSLQTLIVRGCGGVTPGGVKELKKALPKLLVTGPGEGSIAVP
jgi:hypothetical protein